MSDLPLEIVSASLPKRCPQKLCQVPVRFCVRAGNATENASLSFHLRDSTFECINVRFVCGTLLASRLLFVAPNARGMPRKCNHR